MNCPKCRGLMRPELDFDDNIISRGCYICGYRIWPGINIRPPVGDEGDDRHTAAPGRGQRRLTDAEKEYVATQRAAGISCKALAAELKCSEQLIWKTMNRMKQERGTRNEEKAGAGIDLNLEPRTSILEPEVSSLEPEVSILEPEVSAPEPSALSPEPVIALSPERAPRRAPRRLNQRYATPKLCKEQLSYQEETNRVIAMWKAGALKEANHV